MAVRERFSLGSRAWGKGRTLKRSLTHFINTLTWHRHLKNIQLNVFLATIWGHVQLSMSTDGNRRHAISYRKVTIPFFSDFLFATQFLHGTNQQQYMFTNCHRTSLQKLRLRRTMSIGSSEKVPLMFTSCISLKIDLAKELCQRQLWWIGGSNSVGASHLSRRPQLFVNCSWMGGCWGPRCSLWQPGVEACPLAPRSHANRHGTETHHWKAQGISCQNHRHIGGTTVTATGKYYCECQFVKYYACHIKLTAK